jgi:hypothetical protein
MCLDEAGQPIRRKEGFAGYHSTFDAWGNETERRYLDEAGKAARSKAGYAGYRCKFDAHGNRTDVAFFNATGTVTAHQRYDDRRSLTRAEPTQTQKPSRPPQNQPKQPRNQPPEQPSHPTPNASGAGAGNSCQKVIEIAQMCFEHSSLATPCAEIYVRMIAASAGASATPAQRHALASLCEQMCRENQDGTPWAAVRSKLQASCPRYD